MKKNINKIMSVLVTFVLLSQSITASTAENDREELSKYFQMQEENYKKYFDKEMLLEELDYDGEKIIDFVSNSIVFQAYDGILRGVEATLMGRAGNAHDQAITLASMLNDADIEAQIMVGELSAMQARELNQNIAMAKFPQLPQSDTKLQPKIMQEMNAKIEKSVKKYLKENVGNKKNVNSNLAQGIYENISEKAREEGKKTFQKELQSSSLAYRWVRYKNTQDDIWVEVHPAYIKANTWKLKSTSVEAEAVDEKYLQKLSIELWIKTSDGKKHSITGKWTAPAANLTAKTISIDIMSDAMLKINGVEGLAKKLEESHYFFVTINDSLTEEGKVFDIKGRIYPGDTIEGLNTVFAEVGKKLGSVTNMFADTLSFDSKSKATSISLEKVWLEFSIEKPNRKTEIIQRVLFENSAQTKPEEIALTLLQGWDISVNTTKAMSHLYKKNSAKQFLDEVKFINNIKQYTVKNKEEKSRDILSVASSILPNRSLVQLSNTRKHFDAINFDNSISYPSEIQLLALRKGFVFSNDTYVLYKTMDILSNTRWSFYENGGKKSPSLLTSIKHGVWETEAETYKTVKEKGIDTLESAFDLLVLDSNFPTKIKPFNPHQSVKNEKAWWQVDSITGSTKGMIKLPHGYAGGSGTEYTEILSLITGKISEYFFIKGTAECINAGGGAGCCAAINGALWAAGIGGGAVGAANKGVQSFGKEGAAIYMGIASVEFDVGTSYLPVTDICK